MAIPNHFQSDKTMILAPELAFDELDLAFAAAGFVLTEETHLGSAPEPDRACWQHGDDCVRLIRDLATGNLVLVPDEGVSLPPGLALMTPAAVLSLLEGQSVISRLAGLQAASIMADPVLAPAVARLVSDPDPRVAEQTISALAAIAHNLASGTPASGGASLIDPAAALFSVPGWRREKLQVLRWLAHDGAGKAAVEPVLVRALGDPDWEIAVTAMLSAARLEVDTLAPRIARLAMPEGVRMGVTATEHRLLLALRDACLTRLGADRGRRLPPGVMEAVSGDTDRLPPGMAAFVSALVSPLPIVPSPLETPGVSLTATGPVLSDGHLLVWVPPVAHWLGDDELGTPLPNPARRIIPEHGFYIDAEPRGTASFAEARQHAAEVARQNGRPAVLAPPDLWEMAARGPDGRRFPWGANGSESARVDLSPWGMAGVATGPGEWLDEPLSDGTAAVAGGRDAPNPAWRRRAKCQQAHYYRCAYVLVC